MSFDLFAAFIGGVVGGLMLPALWHLIEDTLGHSEWTWYDDDEHLTGVEARRRLFRGDDDV